MSDSNDSRWVDFLDDEDLAFIKRFVLSSGSQKDLATVYDVSYPTLRLRLDRLIQKIKVVENARIDDGFEKLLRVQFADGRLDAALFKKLLTAYQEQKKGA
jgi:hypothetical protein